MEKALARTYARDFRGYRRFLIFMNFEFINNINLSGIILCNLSQFLSFFTDFGPISSVFYRIDFMCHKKKFVSPLFIVLSFF